MIYVYVYIYYIVVFSMYTRLCIGNILSNSPRRVEIDDSVDRRL